MTQNTTLYPQQPWLVCWHASSPLLCVVERDALALWHATEGLVRIPTTFKAPNTVAFLGDHILLADEYGNLTCFSRLGERLWHHNLEPYTGRIDELIVSSHIACLGESLAVLNAQGDMLWHRPDPNYRESPYEAIWHHDCLLVQWDTYWAYFNPTGQVLYQCAHAAARHARVVDGRVEVRACHIQDPFARTYTWSKDLTHVALEGREHIVWLRDHNPLRTIEGHPRTITAMAWSEDHVLYTGCRDGMLRRLNSHDTFDVVSREAGVVDHIIFSADHDWICCSSRDRAMILHRP